MPEDDRRSGDADGIERVGQRLREARIRQQRTLSEVAEHAGVTKGFLSLAERGKTRFSMPTLLRVCDTLDVGIGSLFDHPGPVPTPSGGPPVEMGGQRITEFLLTNAGERHIQVMHTILDIGGGSGGTHTLDAHTVFAYVLRGHVVIVSDRTAHQLREGDSLTFPAHRPHEWHNEGDATAEILWVIAPPLVAAGDEHSADPV